jgi:ribosomal protein L13
MPILMEKGSIHIGHKLVSTAIWVAVGIFICLAYTWQCGKMPEKPATVKPEVIVKEVEKIDLTAKKKQDSIAKVANRRADTISSLKQKLLLYKEDAMIMEGIINELQSSHDTSSLQQYRERVEDYIGISKEKDTACTDAIAALERQVSSGDSLAAAKDTAYTALKRQFERSIDELVKQGKYSADLRRSLKIKRFGSTFWKTAAIAAGVALLIKSGR